MKAVVMRGFGGPEVMEIAEVATPEPGPNQVRVRVLATSVNRADIIQRQGHYPPPPGESIVVAPSQTLTNHEYHRLREIVGVEKTRVLKAAGAIVARATAKEIQAIAKQPLVKAIRTNRRFK